MCISIPLNCEKTCFFNYRKFNLEDDLAGVPHTFSIVLELCWATLPYLQDIFASHVPWWRTYMHTKKLCYSHSGNSGHSFSFELLRTLVCMVVHARGRHGCHFVPSTWGSAAMGLFRVCSLIWNQTNELMVWCTWTGVLSKNYDYLANASAPDSPHLFNTHFKLTCITNFKCSRAIQRGISKAPIVFAVWTEIKLVAITTMWSINMLVGCVCQ